MAFTDEQVLMSLFFEPPSVDEERDAWEGWLGKMLHSLCMCGGMHLKFHHKQCATESDHAYALRCRSL